MMNVAAKVADTLMGKSPVDEGSTRPTTSPTETMLAIVWKGKKDVEVARVPKPLITHPEDALVKITACTVCSGSDSHLYSGEIPAVRTDTILGHEAMGTVTEVGSNVAKIKVGDRVVISGIIACGKCGYCKRKEFNSCDRTNDCKLNEEMMGHRCAAVFGHGDMMGGVPGSQAQFTRVPFADVNCYVVPKEIPDEKAVYMSDILPTSLHATELGEVAKGNTVGIWGLGPVGLLAARWCQLKGARKVIGIDDVPERLTLAKKVLNIDIIDRSAINESVPSAILKMVPQGVDVAIDAVGFRFATSMLHKVERAVGLETDQCDVLNECFFAVRKFGRVSMIADYTGFTNHFAIGHIMFKHLTLRSGQVPAQKYMDFIADHLKKGDMDPTFVISHRLTLEQTPEAYDKLFYKKDGYIKVFIKVN